MKITGLLFTCLLFVHQIFGVVTQKVDSLQERLIQFEEVTPEKIELLNQLSILLWEYQPEESIKYAEQSKSLSSKISDQRGLAYSNLALGLGIWGEGDFNSAMELFLEAQKQIETNGNQNDIAIFKYHIALAYRSEGIIDLSAKNFREILSHFRQNDNDHMVAQVLQDYGEGVIIDRKYERAIPYLDTAFSIWTKRGNELGQYQVQAKYGKIYLKLEDYDQARINLYEARHGLQKLNSQYDLIVVEKDLGNLYTQLNNFDSAEVHFLNALKQAEDLSFKDQVYELYFYMHEFEMNRGDYEKALDYYKKHTSLFDKKLNKEISNRVHEMKIKYDNEKAANEIQLLNEQQKVQNTFIIALSVFIIILSISATIITISLRQGKRKDKMLHESKQALMEAEISNAKLKEKELNLELEKKNVELTSYTMNFIQKGTLVKELQEKMEMFEDSSDSDQAQVIRDLKAILSRHSANDKDWEDFNVFFQNAHPSFISSLKKINPSIGKSDIRLCSLLKLNLNSKQIADIMAISPDSVKTARHRLRNKLNLNRDQNLTDFLAHLEASELVRDT